MADGGFSQHVLHVPDEVLQKVASWLPVDDLTDGLGLTNSCMFHRLFSTTLPYVIREKRLPTKMGYTESGAGVLGRASVYQIQPFCFLLRTATHGMVQVNIKLLNHAWDERHNGRVDPSTVASPGPTMMSVEIVCRDSDRGPCHFFKRNSFWDELDRCNCGHRNCPKCLGYIIEVDGDEGDEDDRLLDEGVDSNGVDDVEGVPSNEETILRSAMIYIFICAKRIQSFPGDTNYPSAGYLMSVLPQILRDYFPSDWISNSESDEPTDRDTVVLEWDYRPARTNGEWYIIVGSLPYEWSEMTEYELQELPWYRPGYWNPVAAPPVPPPEYDPEQLWGNVFVQATMPYLGCSSFHFASPADGGPFISFESPRSFEGGYHPDPEVDIPKRVHFNNIVLDGHRFSGDILWQADYNITLLSGVIESHVEFTFDSAFTTVIASEVHCIFCRRQDGNRRQLRGNMFLTFRNFEPGQMVNAALWEHIRDPSAVRVFFERLQQEGANLSNISVIRQLFSGATNNPVDYSYDF